MNITLTPLQAYIVMTIYLDSYYNHTLSVYVKTMSDTTDDIGLLLSGMQFVGNRTADPSAWSDWINVIDSNQKEFSVSEAFIAMKQYLHNYAERISSTEVKAMLAHIELPSEHTTIDSAYWHNWVECWKIIAENIGDAKSYLTLTK